MGTADGHAMVIMARSITSSKSNHKSLMISKCLDQWFISNLLPEKPNILNLFSARTSIVRLRKNGQGLLKSDKIFEILSELKLNSQKKAKNFLNNYFLKEHQNWLCNTIVYFCLSRHMFRKSTKIFKFLEFFWRSRLTYSANFAFWHVPLGRAL